MIRIHSPKDCCGCSACAQRCPQQCIQMTEDEEGFLYPRIDANRCTDCGLCEKVCPILTPARQQKATHIYASRCTDHPLRQQSSSGGIFTQLAQSILQDNGVVFGACFDEEWNVRHEYTRSAEGLDRLRRSKYVQSNIGRCYAQAETFLRQREKVLFCGTPCQIAGLRRYLRKEYDGLLCVDFLCHGVPSPKVWRMYLDELTARLSADSNRKIKIESINFRNKCTGWHHYSFQLGYRDGETLREFRQPYNQNSFMKGFLCNRTLRPSCYNCPAKSGRSESDITLGDFWGIQHTLPQMDDDKGISLLQINTPRGELYYRQMTHIESAATELNEQVTGYNGGFCEKIAIPECRKEFFAQLNDGASITDLLEKNATPYFQERVIKKIAVLTLPLHANYGGNLQCFALQHKLKEMGYEVSNIRIVLSFTNPPKRRKLKTYWRRLRKKLKGKKGIESIVFLERKMNRDRIISQQHALRFIERHITSTPVYTSAEELRSFPSEEFDAYIVGSDQVWRVPYASPSIETFFLDFLQDSPRKRIVYGASFGTDEKEFSDEQTERCGRLLCKFSAISVREDSAIKMIEDTYGWKCKKPIQVLDPTLLLTPDDYRQLYSSIDLPQPSGELFYYVLDMTDEKQQLIRQLAEEKELKAFTVFPRSTHFEDKAEDKIFPPVEEWLQAFDKAQYIVTDSFHGCVFSILFNKPFIAYGNADRGLARFHSLLRMFQLEDRFITSLSELSSTKSGTSIDWEAINRRLEELRKDSLAFLTSALEQ